MTMILFCSGWWSCSFVSGFVMRLVQTSLCVTTDYASSVSYCVTVCGCALGFSMAYWNRRAMWSSLYSPQAAIVNFRFVTNVPFHLYLATTQAGY